MSWLCFLYSFPNFRCWCHHSSRHLLIWHGCFGGESHYIDRMAWDPSLSNMWTCVMLCADGAPGNPWERRVLLCFSGGHQQCHTVTGGPPAEGEMETVKYTSKCSQWIRLRVWLCSILCVQDIFSKSVWYMFVFLGVNPEMPGIRSR